MAIDGNFTVKVASVGPGNLSTDFANNSFVDGVQIFTGDIILIRSQANPQENGIYTVVHKDDIILVSQSGAINTATTKSTGLKVWLKGIRH